MCEMREVVVNNSQIENSIIRLEILKHNIQKINLISKVLTIIILFLIFTKSIVSKVSIFHTDGTVSNQFIPYIILILFNTVVCFIIDIRKLHITKKNMRNVDFFISFYVTALSFLGALITITDPQFYNQLLIYTLTLIITCTVIVLKLHQLLLSLFVSSVTVFLGLYFQNSVDALFQQQILYLLSLLFITIFLSRSFYFSFHRSIKFQSELLKEAHLTRDLTKKLREANRKLEVQANLDPLTNLFNRRAYNSYIGELEKKAERETFLFTAIMVDVDCFKLFNDTYGHNDGDRALASIGYLLCDLAYKYGCFASRWGGEEFSILLINHSEDTVNQICIEIIDKVKDLKITHHSSFIAPYITVSVGACTNNIHHPKEISTCIQNADEALYFVKERGRNNFEYRQYIVT